jgi:hypothetical protein
MEPPQKIQMRATEVREGEIIRIDDYSMSLVLIFREPAYKCSAK